MCWIYGFRVSGFWIPGLKLKHFGDRVSYPCLVGHGGIKHEYISVMIMWQFSRNYSRRVYGLIHALSSGNLECFRA